MVVMPNRLPVKSQSQQMVARVKISITHIAVMISPEIL